MESASTLLIRSSQLAYERSRATRFLVGYLFPTWYGDSTILLLNLNLVYLTAALRAIVFFVFYTLFEYISLTWLQGALVKDELRGL